MFLEDFSYHAANLFPATVFFAQFLDHEWLITGIACYFWCPAKYTCFDFLLECPFDGKTIEVDILVPIGGHRVRCRWGGCS